MFFFFFFLLPAKNKPQMPSVGSSLPQVWTYLVGTFWCKLELKAILDCSSRSMHAIIDTFSVMGPHIDSSGKDGRYFPGWHLLVGNWKWSFSTAEYDKCFCRTLQSWNHQQNYKIQTVQVLTINHGYRNKFPPPRPISYIIYNPV